MSTILTDRFCDALVYVTKLHANQVRKLSDAPYVSHLLRVAGIVLEHGADEDEAIAALLHDAIEDQGGRQTHDAIFERFGSRVATIVAGCSDTDVNPKPPWRERKDAYLNHLRTASASERLVVAADKLDNCRSLVAGYRQWGDSLWARFHGGREGTLWYFQRVVVILREADPNVLVDDLTREVALLEQLSAC
jgi:(p)ppGpp synthase/HD superfamily hydrolase